ncbi:MAG: penicillin-binding protein 2 [Candidatus Andersenbacteria bacterium]|nr:penicillin-binding protein 2 [Candidatus Andersenbacteria bacterium]
MSSLHTIDEIIPAPRSSPSRFGLLIGILLLGSALLLGRSFYLQIIKGFDFLALAEYNRVTPELLPAPRGILYDKFGRQLTENITSTDLVLDPVLLPKVEDESYLVENLPALLPQLTASAVTEALTRTRKLQRLTLLTKALEHDQVLALGAAGDNVRGTRLVSALVRKYPYGEVAAHALGYTSAVTSEELESDPTLVPTDTTGKSGLEEAYDTPLHGKHGLNYTEVNAAGRPLAQVGRQEPVAGEDLHLTLDIELQKYIYSLFHDRDKERLPNEPPVAGAAVVMDPRDGSIVALVSYPSFDPNIFSQPSLSRGASHYFTDSRQPLFNRAADGTYPSGSIIKPFLAAGGLQEGVITATTTVLSTGGLTIGQSHFLDWKSGGHGVTDVKKAIAESVNTFFYLLAGGDETHIGLGVEKINKYLKEFGWARPTGIDLASEAPGFVPDPGWKEATFHERWYVGDTYHLGIGQGNVLVSPIQIASATASLANGSTLYTPHIKQLEEPKKKKIHIDSQNINIVREGMRQTVTDGSGRQLSTLPIALAGKTGTAQIGGTENTHAWFTSFGPYDSPELVVTVLLEKGGAGDVDAVPMAKAIWQWWLGRSQEGA